MPEHTPVPTPARSLYGFFMYFISKVILGLYCLWAFVPDNILHYLNIYYYPQKFWSTAIPVQCLVALLLFAFFIYPSSNFMLTANIYEERTIHDNFSNYVIKSDTMSFISSKGCICKSDVKCKYKNCEKPIGYVHTVPSLLDLDIRFVSKKLYHNKIG